MAQRIFILALFVLVTVSCKRRTCTTYGIQGVSVVAASGTNLTDTIIKVVRYPKNSSFQNPVDSFQKFYEYYPGNTLTVIFDTSSFANYDYDLVCTLYPSGKTFQINKITHENGKSDKPGLSCVNPVHYFVNGEENVIQGYLGMQGFVLNVMAN